MHKFRRYLIIVLFLGFTALLAYGFYLKSNGDLQSGDRCIGLGIMGGVFIVMPLFIYHRWKDRKVKDYMITPESMERMREFNDKKD
ncbi:hypothetical protein [Croceiramulus getboli]|nr:hypothetical protein P8624_03635 [Flavobacteriaceae bacterium YJPT1-3]